MRPSITAAVATACKSVLNSSLRRRSSRDDAVTSVCASAAPLALVGVVDLVAGWGRASDEAEGSVPPNARLSVSTAKSFIIISSLFSVAAPSDLGRQSREREAGLDLLGKYRKWISTFNA